MVSESLIVLSELSSGRFWRRWQLVLMVRGATFFLVQVQASSSSTEGILVSSVDINLVVMGRGAGSVKTELQLQFELALESRS